MNKLEAFDAARDNPFCLCKPEADGGSRERVHEAAGLLTEVDAGADSAKSCRFVKPRGGTARRRCAGRLEGPRDPHRVNR